MYYRINLSSYPNSFIKRPIDYIKAIEEPTSDYVKICWWESWCNILSNSGYYDEAKRDAWFDSLIDSGEYK